MYLCFRPNQISQLPTCATEPHSCRFDAPSQRSVVTARALSRNHAALQGLSLLCPRNAVSRLLPFRPVLCHPVTYCRTLGYGCHGSDQNSYHFLSSVHRSQLYLREHAIIQSLAEADVRHSSRPHRAFTRIEGFRRVESGRPIWPAQTSRRR